MSQTNRSIRSNAAFLLSIVAGFLLVGCHSNSSKSAGSTEANQSMNQPMPSAMESARAAIRINAGDPSPYTDSSGHVWMADQGFDGGDIVTRDDDVKIAKTKDPMIYRNEHYGMNAFSQKVPNGKYTVKLHFCETYEDNTSAGTRVFSFNVEGHEFKDFDLFEKAGGALQPYVQTVNVDVTDGKLDITFTASVGDPEINGIEIIPE